MIKHFHFHLSKLNHLFRVKEKYFTSITNKTSNYKLSGLSDTSIAFLDILNRELHILSDTNRYDHSPVNTLKHINKIRQLLSLIQAKGFIGEWDLNLSKNPVYKKIFELLPSLESKLTIKDIDSSNIRNNQIFHREHLNNLILLSLLTDLKLMENTTNFKELSVSDQGIFHDVLVLRNLLTHKISGNIRRAIGLNRLQILERIYIGFDTEFVVKEYKQNDLLCSTIALFPRVLLKINKFNIDSINYSLNSEPCLYKLDRDLKESLFTSISLLRSLDGRNDSYINHLLGELIGLDGDLVTMYEENNSFLFTKEGDFSPDKFKTLLFDHRDKKEGSYSLRFLIEKSLNNTKTLRIQALNEILNLIMKITVDIPIKDSDI